MMDSDNMDKIQLGEVIRVLTIEKSNDHPLNINSNENWVEDFNQWLGKELEEPEKTIILDKTALMSDIMFDNPFKETEDIHKLISFKYSIDIALEVCKKRIDAMNIKKSNFTIQELVSYTMRYNNNLYPRCAGITAAPPEANNLLNIGEFKTLYPNYKYRPYPLCEDIINSPFLNWQPLHCSPPKLEIKILNHINIYMSSSTIGSTINYKLLYFNNDLTIEEIHKKIMNISKSIIREYPLVIERNKNSMLYVWCEHFYLKESSIVRKLFRTSKIQQKPVPEPSCDDIFLSRNLYDS